MLDLDPCSGQKERSDLLRWASYEEWIWILRQGGGSSILQTMQAFLVWNYRQYPQI
jgi:hypothetical protein